MKQKLVFKRLFSNLCPIFNIFSGQLQINMNSVHSELKYLYSMMELLNPVAPF